MKKILFVGAAIAAILALSNVSQNQRDKREKVQTTILLGEVREISNEPPKPAQSATPCTMHVTQKVGLLFDAQQVLDLLRPGK